MKRTLNWTGRRNIPAHCVQIRLQELLGGTSSFSAEFAGLEGLSLDPAARLYVEPYAGSSSMRFDFGTISLRRTPEDTTLSEIDAGGSVLFRVRVVDESGDVGKILAAADGIRAVNDDDDGRKSILPVKMMDLGEAIWNLEIDPHSGPLLALNNRLPSLADDIRSNPILQGAIVPHAVRQVLEYMLLDDEASPEAEWVKDWHAFAAAINGGQEMADLLGDPDEIRIVIAETVSLFNERSRWTSRQRTLIDSLQGAISSD
ncbi:MAG: hypothetical protein WC809_19610 [Sinimarinibacterium sp.]|jgi:hypothetical protein